ncbi:MAG TPA: hypothetical protein VMW72_11095, partial [Sedimentisphaerales bacterium]|nr:hypothetical protein [Sedimentisphaerales bacterium]
LPILAGCGFGWRCQQNSDYQPVGLRFASLPALSSLEPKRNLISLPVLSVRCQQAGRDLYNDKHYLLSTDDSVVKSAPGRTRTCNLRI